MIGANYMPLKCIITTLSVGILYTFPACTRSLQPPPPPSSITDYDFNTTTTVAQPSLVVDDDGLLPDDDAETTTTAATALTTDTDTVNLTVVQQLCWTSAECSVAAEFNRVELNFKFPVNIDCTEHDASSSAAAASVWPRQYSNITQISLNGCSVGRDNTLGVEFVPDPGAVRRLQVRMFRVAGAISGGTFDRFGGLSELELVDNIVDGFADDSLTALHDLRTLDVCNNNLSYVSDAALVAMARLEQLTLKEPSLCVQAGLQLPALRELCLQTKNFTWLDQWPVSLETVSLSHTAVEYSNDAVAQTLQSLHSLHTLEITACNLSSWPTFSHTRLRLLNISHNQLQHLDEFQMPALETLDISGNRLLDLSDTMFRPLCSLRTVHAQHNRIDRLASNAFGRNAQLDEVYLNDNRLREIAPGLSVQQEAVRMYIDGNPWSCKWALDVFGTQPQMFAHFRYAKVLDNVNMRGLSCRFYENGGGGRFGGKVLPADLDVSHGNRTGNSTTTYRRHPKDTAMLTLIILVVGVTFLFLLLFLHIRCRREAMQPFYRSLPLDQQRRQPGGNQQPPSMAERTDYVRRELPATDYEAPLMSRSGRGRVRTTTESSNGGEKPRTSDMDVGGGDRVYEEIKDCNRTAAKLFQESKECPSEPIELMKPVRPKQKYASMNNMLYDKSGGGGNGHHI